MTPLRIALVGHGCLPIPPPAWGAVENTIWQTKIRLEAKGHTVHIVNVPHRQVLVELLRLSRRSGLDWAVVHAERAVGRALAAGWLGRFQVAESAHRPYAHWTGLTKEDRRNLDRIARAKYHLAIIRPTAHEILKRNPRAVIGMIPNGVSVRDIRIGPAGNGRAICLGRIEPRKRQNELARWLEGSNVHVDFAGPEAEPLRTNPNATYLGEWKRATTMVRLTEYSASILLSFSEVQSLAIAESLAAGLSVVVSPGCSANLDLDQPFVHLVERDDDAVPTLARAIAAADAHRAEARRWAEENLDYDIVTNRTEGFLLEWTKSSKRSG